MPAPAAAPASSLRPPPQGLPLAPVHPPAQLESGITVIQTPGCAARLFKYNVHERRLEQVLLCCLVRIIDANYIVKP
jgi:hypothetical protein